MINNLYTQCLEHKLVINNFLLLIIIIVSYQFNWYTKRVSLAAVYKSTELCFIQDQSDDFHNTWEFLDRRLGDLALFGKCVKSVQQGPGKFSDLAYGAVNVVSVTRVILSSYTTRYILYIVITVVAIGQRVLLLCVFCVVGQEHSGNRCS